MVSKFFICDIVGNLIMQPKLSIWLAQHVNKKTYNNSDFIRTSSKNWISDDELIIFL